MYAYSTTHEAFNRILSDLLALEVKLEKDKALMLLSSLPLSYAHLTITIMYDKKTLELKDVRQMLQNELMKKMDFTEEASGLVVKGQRGRSKSKGPKRDPDDSISNACCYCKKPGHIKKNYIKFKDMLKKKGGKDSDGLVLVKSHYKPVLSEKKMRIYVIF